MSQAPTLLQFHYSHFCEKVRWTLDYKAIPHFRRNLMPGPHAPRILALTGQRRVPVLQLDGANQVGSAAIIAALERLRPKPALYPESEADRRRALDLEAWLDEELGLAVIRCWYDHLLKQPDYLRAMWSVGQPTSKRRTYRLLLPGVLAVTKRQYGLTPARVTAARRTLTDVLDRLARERAESDYLVGGAFSVADLTAGSLLSWLVPPGRSPYRLQTKLPEAAGRWQASIGAHPTMEWVSQLYERHRGISMAENREVDGSGVL